MDIFLSFSFQKKIITLGFGAPSTLQANEILFPSSVLILCRGITNLGGCAFLTSEVWLRLDSRGVSTYLNASGFTIGVESTPEEIRFLGC
jgi:hypothetical protein